MLLERDFVFISQEEQQDCPTRIFINLNYVQSTLNERSKFIPLYRQQQKATPPSPVDKMSVCHSRGSRSVPSSTFTLVFSLSDYLFCQDVYNLTYGTVYLGNTFYTVGRD